MSEKSRSFEPTNHKLEVVYETRKCSDVAGSISMTRDNLCSPIANRIPCRRDQQEISVINGKGIPGDGIGDALEFVCGRCRTEFMIADARVCGNCGNEKLFTREEREADITAKVEALRAEKASRIRSRDYWQRYQRTRELVTGKRSHTTKYEEWSMWVPESSDDEDTLMGPICRESFN